VAVYFGPTSLRASSTRRRETVGGNYQFVCHRDKVSTRCRRPVAVTTRIARQRDAHTISCRIWSANQTGSGSERRTIFVVDADLNSRTWLTDFTVDTVTGCAITENVTKKLTAGVTVWNTLNHFYGGGANKSVGAERRSVNVIAHTDYWVINFSFTQAFIKLTVYLFTYYDTKSIMATTISKWNKICLWIVWFRADIIFHITLCRLRRKKTDQLFPDYAEIVRWMILFFCDLYCRNRDFL